MKPLAASLLTVLSGTAPANARVAGEAAMSAARTKAARGIQAPQMPAASGDVRAQDFDVLLAANTARETVAAASPSGKTARTARTPGADAAKKSAKDEAVPNASVIAEPETSKPRLPAAVAITVERVSASGQVEVTAVTPVGSKAAAAAAAAVTPPPAPTPEAARQTNPAGPPASPPVAQALAQTQPQLAAPSPLAPASLTAPETERPARPAAARRTAADESTRDLPKTGPDARTENPGTAPQADRAVPKQVENAAAPAKPIEPQNLGLRPATGLADAAQNTQSPNGQSPSSTAQTAAATPSQTPGATPHLMPAIAVRAFVRPDGVTRAIEIRLDPPELGAVSVRLETAKDGRLRAVLSAERPEAFELMKREGGVLEQALRDAGVDLEEAGLSFTLEDGGAGHSFAEARREFFAGDYADLSATETITPPPAIWRDGLIDLSV